MIQIKKRMITFLKNEEFAKPDYLGNCDNQILLEMDKIFKLLYQRRLYMRVWCI